MPEYPWFEAVSGGELQQGDLLLQLPVPEFIPSTAGQTGNSQILVHPTDCIILTQSCDLTVRSDGTCSAEQVILCIARSRPVLKQKPFDKWEGWEDARKGRFPRHHVLNRSGLPDVQRDFSLVDLGFVVAMGVEHVRRFAEEAGPRLRLLPPYREHLSQAFARMYMRVGLPADLPSFRPAKG